MFIPAPFWVPPFLVCVWLVIFALAARLGGWHALGQRFRTSVEPDGERFGGQSVSMGLANYGGCVTIVVAAAGLYLRVFAPFRFFHPPLLIPWPEIRVVKVHDGRWIRNALVEVGQPVLARVTLPLQVIEGASVYLLESGEKETS